MKQLLAVILVITTINAGAQVTAGESTSQMKFSTQIAPPFTSLWDEAPTDTVKCHYLQVTNDSTFEWKTGYVIGSSGNIKFEGEIIASYSITGAIHARVLSAILDRNKAPIKTYAISIIVLPKKQP